MVANILTRIADRRRARIAEEGYGLSCPVPQLRRLPGKGAVETAGRAGGPATEGPAESAGLARAANAAATEGPAAQGPARGTGAPTEAGPAAESAGVQSAPREVGPAGGTDAPTKGGPAGGANVPAETAGGAGGPTEAGPAVERPAGGANVPAERAAWRARSAGGPTEAEPAGPAGAKDAEAAQAPAGVQSAPRPFLPQGGVVCEVKRRSPSRGDISEGLDPLEQARLYVERGADAVSILTEENSFGGCIADLAAVKERFPELPLLRKDFLLDVRDVEVSYQAGADAVLLIAALLSPQELSEMHAAATGLGMAALVEVHDEREIASVSSLEPALLGINARDLTTFFVDPLTPLRLRPAIDWPARVVYESGVFEAEQAAVAASAGFDSVLVGEAVVRDPDRIARIRSGLENGSKRGSGNNQVDVSPRPDFWPRLTARMRDGRPLVKVCGITRHEDAAEAVRLGADLLGFVFADSPRRANPAVVRECRDLDCLKVAVVVTETGPDGRRLPEGVGELLREGSLDAVQFHGEEAPRECADLGFPYYKALRLRSVDDVALLDEYFCPRVLVDAFSREAHGGTGCTIAPETVAAVADRGPLWLAGGLNPETIAAALVRYEPELVDASSGLEAEPGRKDHKKLAAFFREIASV